VKLWAVPFTRHLEAGHQDVVHSFEDMDPTQPQKFNNSSRRIRT
jgi:hypothetical protein